MRQTSSRTVASILFTASVTGLPSFLQDFRQIAIRTRDFGSSVDQKDDLRSRFQRYPRLF